MSDLINESNRTFRSVSREYFPKSDVTIMEFRNYTENEKAVYVFNWFFGGLEKKNKQNE